MAGSATRQIEARLHCDLARGLDKAARHTFSVRAFVNISGRLEFNVDHRRTVTKTIQQMVLRRTKAAANLKPGLSWESSNNGGAVEEAGVGHIYQVSQVCETVCRHVFTDMRDFVHVTGKLSFNIDNRRLVTMDLSHMVLHKPDSPVSPVDIDTDCGETFSPPPSPDNSTDIMKQEPGNQQYVVSTKLSPDSERARAGVTDIYPVTTEGTPPKMMLFSPSRPHEVLTSVNRGPRVLSFARMEPIQLPATSCHQYSPTSQTSATSPMRMTSPVAMITPTTLTLPIVMTPPRAISSPKVMTSPMTVTSQRVRTTPSVMTSPLSMTSSPAMTSPATLTSPLTHKSPATQSMDWEASSSLYDSGVCDLFSSPRRIPLNSAGRSSQQDRYPTYSPLPLTIQALPSSEPEPLVSPQGELLNLSLEEDGFKWGMLPGHCPPPDSLWPSLEEENKPQSGQLSPANRMTVSPGLVSLLNSHQDGNRSPKLSSMRICSSKKSKPPETMDKWQQASPTKHRGRKASTRSKAACAESIEKSPPRPQRVSTTDTDGMSTVRLSRDNENIDDINTDRAHIKEALGAESLGNHSAAESMAGDFCKDFPSDYEQLLDADGVASWDYDDKFKEICKRNSEMRDKIPESESKVGESDHEVEKMDTEGDFDNENNPKEVTHSETENSDYDLNVKKIEKDYSLRKKRKTAYNNENHLHPNKNEEEGGNIYSEKDTENIANLNEECNREMYQQSSEQQRGDEGNKVYKGGESTQDEENTTDKEYPSKKQEKVNKKIDSCINAHDAKAQGAKKRHKSTKKQQKDEDGEDNQMATEEDISKENDCNRKQQVDTDTVNSFSRAGDEKVTKKQRKKRNRRNRPTDNDTEEDNKKQENSRESYQRVKAKRRRHAKITETQSRNDENDEEEEDSDYGNMFQKMQRAYEAAKKKIEKVKQAKDSTDNEAVAEDFLRDGTTLNSTEETVHDIGESEHNSIAEEKAISVPPERLNKTQNHGDCATDHDIGPMSSKEIKTMSDNMKSNVTCERDVQDRNPSNGEPNYSGDDNAAFTKIYDTSDALHPCPDENRMICSECSFTTDSPGLFRYHKLKEHSIWKEQFNTNSVDTGNNSNSGDVNINDQHELQRTESKSSDSQAGTLTKAVVAGKRYPLTRQRLMQHCTSRKVSADESELNISDSSQDLTGLLKRCSVRLQKLRDNGYNSSTATETLHSSSQNVSEDAHETSSDDATKIKSKKRVKKKNRRKPDIQKYSESSMRQLCAPRQRIERINNHNRYDSTEEEEDINRISNKGKPNSLTRISMVHVERHIQPNNAEDGNFPSSSTDDEPFDFDTCPDKTRKHIRDKTTHVGLKVSGRTNQNSDFPEALTHKPTELAPDSHDNPGFFNVKVLQTGSSNMDINSKVMENEESHILDESIVPGHPSEPDTLLEQEKSKDINTLTDLQSSESHEGERTSRLDTGKDSNNEHECLVLTLSVEEKEEEDTSEEIPSLKAPTDSPESPEPYLNSSSETEGFEYSDKNVMSYDDNSDPEDDTEQSRKTIEQENEIGDGQKKDEDLNISDGNIQHSQHVLDPVEDLNAEAEDKMDEGNESGYDMEERLNERLKKQSQLVLKAANPITFDRTSPLLTTNEQALENEHSTASSEEQEDEDSKASIEHSSHEYGEINVKSNAKASQRRRFQAGNIVFNFPLRDAKESKARGKAEGQGKVVEKTIEKISENISARNIKDTDSSVSKQNQPERSHKRDYSCTARQCAIPSKCLGCKEDIPKSIKLFNSHSKNVTSPDAQAPEKLDLHFKYSQQPTTPSFIGKDWKDSLYDQKGKDKSTSTNCKLSSFEDKRDRLGRFCCLNCPFKSNHVKIYTSHIQQNHARDIRYQCNVCGKVSKRSDRFMRHLYQHLLENNEMSDGQNNDFHLSREESSSENVKYRPKEATSSTLVHNHGTNSNTGAHQIRLHLYVKNKTSSHEPKYGRQEKYLDSETEPSASTQTWKDHPPDESINETDHEQDTFMKCPFCFKGGFRNLAALMRHKRCCGDDKQKDQKRKKAKCPICLKKIGIKQNVQAHVSVAHKLTCLSCRVTFQDGGSLESHQCQARKQVLMCPECGKLYTSRKFLDNHIRLFHECLPSNKKIVGPMQKHMGMGEKHKSKSNREENINFDSVPPTSDDILQDTYPSKEERIKACCYVCLSNLNTTKTLESHLYKHNITFKKYMCLRCGRQFSQKARLDNHITTKHSEELYKCVICGLVLSTFQDLLLHKKTHNEIRTCRYCDKVLHSVWHKQRHEKWHERHNLLRCDTCQIGFENISSLLEHKIAKHPKTTSKNEHVCPVCRYKYEEICDMYQHISHVHKGNSEATAWLDQQSSSNPGKTISQKHKPPPLDTTDESSTIKNEMADLLSVLPGDDLPNDPLNSSGVSEMLKDFVGSSIAMFGGQNLKNDSHNIEAKPSDDSDCMIEFGKEEMLLSPMQIYYRELSSGTNLKPEVKRNLTI